MKLKLAKKAGFCFGVKRAIDITFDLAKESKKGVYTYGPLIHNPQVVDELKRKGIAAINELESSDINTLIIRTHGVSPEVYEKTSEMGYNLIDLTCPFVKKAQNYAKILRDENYQVLIIGNEDHPEVKGLIGFAGDNVMVVKDAASLPKLNNKVGLIVQTTQRFDTFREVVLEVISRAREVKIYNTICDFTAQRVKETRELACMVDVMVVVGGKNSSNTNQLVKLSHSVCNNVYHIETQDELEKEWFHNVKNVGVTGGASTPHWIIEEVVKKIRDISKEVL
jgi:4-hydroxy-3-methylbut-2-enyl diphosphate reductase